MSQQELLRRVVETLDAIGVDYMVVGSFASSFQGEPRSTHDIGLVVTITPASVGPLVAAFPPPDFYLDAVSVRQAIASRQMFNLLDVTGGDKVDFWVLTDDPYDRERFDRRARQVIDGLELFMLRPEDTILTKLKWSDMSGGSEKQFTDALRVYEVQHGTLDLAYIDQRAKALGVEEEWKRLKSEAEVP